MAADAPKRKRKTKTDVDRRARDADRYDRHKEAARQRNADASQAGRDIGELPPVGNPKRRGDSERNFRQFCETYLAANFPLAWGRDHLRVLDKIETVALEGGLVAIAMPRGSGKSTICEAAVMWSILYGHRRFVVLIGAEATSAEQSLDSIKTELETNELLADDFPEVVYPIQCLDGIANRCKGQTHGGERTRIGWTKRQVILPTIAGSKASGAILRVAGILGRIRGMRYKLADGTILRPDLVLPDDPQTDASAQSVGQCARREGVLGGAVLGLAGPGKKIAGLMPCTVIRAGDMADRVLDRNAHPEWAGERCKLLYAAPENEKLWGQYGEILLESLRKEEGVAAATKFYQANREAMDKGADVAWPARFDPDQISGVQYAMTLQILNPQSFAAEYQNDPQSLSGSDEEPLTADAIASRLNRLPRRTVPAWATRLSAFVDVQGSCLFYLVAAWADDFTGAAIDYGAWPDQRQPYYTTRTLKRTLAELTKAGSLEGQIFEGLNGLGQSMLGREYRRDDGASLRIDLAMVDAGWGDSTDVVHKWCRESAWSAIVRPSKGLFVGADSRPLTERKKKAGERLGLHWRQVKVGQRASLLVEFDANFWKSFCNRRLRTSIGDPGAFTLWGERSITHRLLADHLTSELCTQKKGRERTIDVWTLPPAKPDNHLWDCLVGAAVAASMLGVKLPEAGDGGPAMRRRFSFKDAQQRVRAGTSVPGPDVRTDAEDPPEGGPASRAGEPVADIADESAEASASSVPPSIIPPSSVPPAAAASPPARIPGSARPRVSFAEMQRKARG